MIPRVWSDLRQLAGSWKEEADRRRAVFAADPAAGALDYAAAELVETVRLLEGRTLMLTTSEFGQAHGVCAQTVRNWCARGAVAGAIMMGGEWRIPRDAAPPTTRLLAHAS